MRFTPADFRASREDDLYGGGIAEVYDLMYPFPMSERVGLADYLTRIAAGQRVLELGVGTGRIAIPLAEAGFTVTGIDLSAAMLARLRANDPQVSVRALRADFTTYSGADTVDIVLLMCSSLFFAGTLQAQIAVFRSASAALEPGGHLLVETFDPSRYHKLSSSEVQVRDLDEKTLLLERFDVDPTQQTLRAKHTVFHESGHFSFHHELRYAFPFELDAIASTSNLSLVERASGWHREPWTSGTDRVLSLYRKAAE